jgi:hypothetical protein
MKPRYETQVPADLPRATPPSWKESMVRLLQRREDQQVSTASHSGAGQSNFKLSNGSNGTLAYVSLASGEILEGKTT